MILYTIYDPDIIFNYESPYNNEANTKYSEIYVDGIMVQAVQLNNNDYCINRIISTNPMDYLNPKLQPGSIVQP
jgi:hypothetical protein